MIKKGTTTKIPKGFIKVTVGNLLVWEKNAGPVWKGNIQGTKQGTMWNLNSELKNGYFYVFKINGILENGIFVKPSIILQNNNKRIITLNFDKNSEAKWKCTETVTSIIVQQVRGWSVIQIDEYK